MAWSSAPGKVLICGGYLVVETPHIGLSIGVTARFRTRVVEDVPTSSDDFEIRILSPQFKAEFVFAMTEVDGEIRINQQSGPNSPFLLLGVLYSLASVRLQSQLAFPAGRSLTLELLASNDFYSQRNFLEAQGKTVTVANLRAVPEHQPLVGEVSKTGLGSSAAMTVSLVGCIHKHFECADAVEIIHRVAQVAHSVAQGKIGSGFDVYTATYGTCIYQRFPAALVEAMMAGSCVPSSASLQSLRACIDPSRSWVTALAFRGLPRYFKLLLADIHQGGSSTPGMVAKVMAWRKSVAGEEGNPWDLLASSNAQFVQLLQQLAEHAAANTAEYDAAISTFVSSKTQLDASHLLLQASSAAATCRGLLRQVGELAGVEIEPLLLQPLLDATLALPGVFTVGCPGAGGFDAVYALALGDEAASQVEQFWESYPQLHVCPLLVREDARGMELGP